MYPTGELERLARHKRSLVARAAVMRASCYMSGTVTLRPFLWIDVARAVWNRISPFVAMGTLLLSSRRRFGRRIGFFGLALRWAPKLWKIAKNLRRPAAAVPY